MLVRGLSGGQGAVTITLVTQDITAQDGIDYTGGTFTVTIAANEMNSDPIYIPLLSDDVEDSYETYRLRIVSINGGIWNGGGLGYADFHIDDITLEATDDEADAGGDPVEIQVLANDSNPVYVWVSSVTPPSHGTVEIGEHGLPVYTREADYFGNDSFTYTVQDVFGHTATATVRIRVNCACILQRLAVTLNGQMAPIYQQATEASDLVGTKIDDAERAYADALAAADTAYDNAAEDITTAYNGQFTSAENTYAGKEATAQSEFDDAMAQVDQNSPGWEDTVQQITDLFDSKIEAANDERYAAVAAAAQVYETDIHAARSAWNQEIQTAAATREQEIDDAIQEYNDTIGDLQSQTDAIYANYNNAIIAAGCVGGAAPPQFVAMEAPQPAMHNFVDTGVKVALTYLKGGGITGAWNPVFGFPTHGFIIVNGTGYGFWPEDALNNGVVRTNELTRYPPYNADLPKGTYYFLSGRIVIDDTEHNVTAFKAYILAFIVARQANPGEYTIAARNCFVFVTDAIQYALGQSRIDPSKPTATEAFYGSMNYWPNASPVSLFAPGMLPVGPSRFDARAYIKVLPRGGM